MKQNYLKSISAKDLGKLNMPDFCPRCFWYERHIGKAPGIFPGIFSTLDSVSKRSTHRSFNNQGQPPEWLPIPDAIEVVEDDTTFKLPVEHGDWILIGKPDDILKTKDNAYHIIDYKTAKFTERQDELFPLYEIQLNCYAFLAEKYGFKPIRNLSLIYCHPHDDLDSDENFKLGFETYIVDIKIDLEKIPKILLKAREILDQPQPPKSRKDCKDLCYYIDKVKETKF
ncbi:PD-(D/E)XK nuclease family protein [Patescibacteria group bacterium]|nr:PD-(D/E)XK nuclease family protein [Patescibacteria group bacterium]MBU3922855.1 PD-(D/E)XK nuclease family protein [Patescibacteria group bacterium]